jgi:hypothetical protein
VPRHLLDLAREAAVPHPLTAAGRHARFGDSRDHPIERGQIWRAAWGDVSLLILVADVDHAEIDAIAVTLDPGAEDAEAIILAPSLTAFGVEVTLWMGLRASLPLRVLDEIVDEIPDRLIDWLASSSSNSTTPIPKGAQVGQRTSTAFETSTSIRAGVEDDLEALQAAPALPTSTQPETPTRTLASLLGRAVDLSVLVVALNPLGFSQSDVMTLLRGKRPLTPDVVEVIAKATGVDPTLIADAVQPLPAEFVEEVDHPRWRPVWRERANNDGVDEATARLRVSYEIFALAARQTGSQSPDWTARLAQFRRRRAGPEASQ